MSRISNLLCRYPAVAPVTDMPEAFDAGGGLWLRRVCPLEDQA
ncbi:MAG: hypothetical protein QF844_10540 [Acidimicrobiales bacterium]|nr:hypothetical protein [Acidimicrobiales bacterium]